MQIRKFRDDASAWNCISRAAQEVQAYIILLGKGTLEERERLATEIRQMRKEMQISLIERGREGFDEIAKKWSVHPLASNFERQLNRQLSIVPAPKRRSEPTMGGAGYG